MNKNITEIRVRFADTSRDDHAYYAIYLNWLEIGRTEFLRDNGLSYGNLGNGLSAPVIRLEIDFKNAANWDELLLIETKIEKIGNSSLVFDYVITRKPDKELIATAKTIQVFINEKREKVKVPEEIRKIIS